jgi:hypothetical protein
MLRNSAKIQPMSTAARFVRGLLLAAVLCTVGRVFSGASTHAQKNEITSHQPEIPVWIGNAQRQAHSECVVRVKQSQAYSSEAALPPIRGIALRLPYLASAVIPRTTNTARQSKGAALHQRPPPPPSSI